MKKIMSLVLALALVLSMGVTVFAAENSGSTTVTDPIGAEGNSKNVDVTAGYEAPIYKSAGTVYHVVIGWKQSGTITYTDAKNVYNWTVSENDNGKYVKDETKSTEAKWTVSDAAVEITVTNKSNAAITATCGAPAVTGNVTGVTGKYDTTSNGTLNLASAAPAESELPTNLEGTERTATATYTITDVKGSINGDKTTIATISVTIAKKAN